VLRRMERSAVHLLRKRGKSLRAIAAELGHSKTTIARALSEPVDQPPTRRQRVSLVDPWRSQIGEWLSQRPLRLGQLCQHRRPAHARYHVWGSSTRVQPPRLCSTFTCLPPHCTPGYPHELSRVN
jgi:transposase